MNQLFQFSAVLLDKIQILQQATQNRVICNESKESISSDQQLHKYDQSLGLPQLFLNVSSVKVKFGMVSTCPPSTGTVTPVMQVAASVHMNRAQFAISSGLPSLLIGRYSTIWSFSVWPLSRLKPQVPSMIPGQIPTTLTPLGPSSTAMCLVRASTPALAVPAWLCRAVPLQCRLAEILMITPPFLKQCWFTYLDSRNVPTVSIISTVVKAFLLRFSKGHRKLPAAPLTSMSMPPCSLSTFLTVSSTCLSSLTSQVLPNAQSLPVSFLSRCTPLLTFSSLRLMMQTVAPCRRNCLAMPQQIPVPPPLIRATLLASTDGEKIDIDVFIISSLEHYLIFLLNGQVYDMEMTVTKML